jgi:hypothetical protein
MTTGNTPCRDMGHYLVELATRYPDHRESLKAVVDRETNGVASPEELEALLTNGFPYPAGLAPGDSPRARPAEGGGAPPAEAVAADGAVLVEDHEPVE